MIYNENISKDNLLLFLSKKIESFIFFYLCTFDCDIQDIIDILMIDIKICYYLNFCMCKFNSLLLNIQKDKKYYYKIQKIIEDSFYYSIGILTLLNDSSSDNIIKLISKINTNQSYDKPKKYNYKNDSNYSDSDSYSNDSDSNDSDSNHELDCSNKYFLLLFSNCFSRF